MSLVGRGVLLLALWLACAQAGKAQERPLLVLNNPTAAPLTDAAGGGFLDRLMDEAGRRAGVRIRLVSLPAERALINANAGIEDGDLNRIAGLEQAYPNLVRVPEKNMDMRFVAFTRSAGLRCDGWTSLDGRAVGLIKGWKILEQNLPPGAHVTFAKDAQQLFRLLEMRRVDWVLYAEHMGEAQARALGLDDLRAAGPPLAVQEMFVYLHAKHAALVPRLAGALKAIKNDGTYARLERETLRTGGSSR